MAFRGPQAQVEPVAEIDSWMFLSIVLFVPF
jgi:hypothetical protein